MRHEDTVRELVSILNPQNEARPTVLLGAGASFSSGVPLADESVKRIARRYSEGLADVAIVPAVASGGTSVWAQYTIRLNNGRRDLVASVLRHDGIPTGIYYPVPLHLQEPYKHFAVAEGGAPVSERLAGEVISLPMHAYLDETTQDRIIEAVREALDGGTG